MQEGERKGKKEQKKWFFEIPAFSRVFTISTILFLPRLGSALLPCYPPPYPTLPSLSPSFLSSSRVVSLDGIPVLSVKEACDESLPYFSLGVAQRKKANRNLRFTMQAKEVGCARLIPTSWPAFIRDTWRFDKKKKRLVKSGSTLASHCLSSVPFNGVAQFVLILVEFNSLNYLQSDVNCIWDIVSMNNFLYHTFRF